ncbi:MAG: hypothetical protein QI223_01360, partial [Candidatus Korarchaeota archaeon]|nr:hypothetical protein [Candidatus Korarchaeota archaeon]
TWPPLPVQYREAMEGGESPRLDFDLDVLSALAEASGAHLDEDETRTKLASLYADILELL